MTAVGEKANSLQETPIEKPQTKTEGPVCMTPDMVAQGLSLLSRIGSGLRHAYIKLKLASKGLTDISLVGTYLHLRFLDLTDNQLQDLSPLALLPELLWLKADRNAISSLHGQPFPQLKYLQYLSLTQNQITDLEGLVGPSLESLNLTCNCIRKISGLQSENFANLVILDLRGNQLETTNGINLPNLQQLYLGQNIIRRLEGLDKLERLTTLHLRDNMLPNLDGLSRKMKCLQYLNARGNQIVDGTCVKGITRVSKTLKALVLTENPLATLAQYRLIVLTIIPELDRLDKSCISYDEKCSLGESKDQRGTN